MAAAERYPSTRTIAASTAGVLLLVSVLLQQHFSTACLVNDTQLLERDPHLAAIFELYSSGADLIPPDGVRGLLSQLGLTLGRPRSRRLNTEGSGGGWHNASAVSDDYSAVAPVLQDKVTPGLPPAHLDDHDLHHGHDAHDLHPGHDDHDFHHGHDDHGYDDHDYSMVSDPDKAGYHG